MTLDKVMVRLQSLSEPAVFARNEKNGAAGAQFGVPLGDIRTLAKAIKINPALAQQLWATGNVDARLLAVLIVKPKTLSLQEVEGLVRSNSFLWVSDWLNSYIVKQHPDKEALRLGWEHDLHPMAARAYWSLTAERVQKSPQGVDLSALLDRIEAEMPQAPDAVQWTMNTTMATIGIHHPALRARAIDLGERLGIYRDYPTPKGCTSPFAPLWIAEMVRRAG